MVHIEDGKLFIIKGNESEICCDLETALRSFREILEKKHGEKVAEDVINRVVDNAKKSEQQAKKDMLKDCLNMIMERLGEKNERTE